jgi:hypothetical protein
MVDTLMITLKRRARARAAGRVYRPIAPWLVLVCSGADSALPSGENWTEMDFIRKNTYYQI